MLSEIICLMGIGLTFCLVIEMYIFLFKTAIKVLKWLIR